MTPDSPHYEYADDKTPPRLGISGRALLDPDISIDLQCAARSCNETDVRLISNIYLEYRCAIVLGPSQFAPMPRFTAFGRRKSTADNLNSAVVQSSFRVLERSEVNGKKLDGGGRSSSRTHLPPTRASNLTGEDNIFAGLKLNRYVLRSLVVVVNGT